MSFDEQGWFWLTDPLLAATVLVLVMATVVWSHAWIVRGRPVRPHLMARRMPRSQRLAAAVQPIPATRPRLTFVAGCRSAADSPIGDDRAQKAA